MMATVDLLWIPLGAGQHVVRLSGRAFETLCAVVRRRPRSELYHSALVVTVPDGRHVIEMTPVADRHGDRRGVVAEGAVGSKWLARLRPFRYEIHRWSGGEIPDADQALPPVTFHVTADDAERLLAAVPHVPTPVWGRDELGTGEMWNSNSVTSWVLHSSGIDTTRIEPPHGGRAPGWNAGVVVAGRLGEPAVRPGGCAIRAGAPRR